MSVTVLYPFTGDQLLIMMPRSGWTNKRLIIMCHDEGGSSADFKPTPGTIGDAAAYLAHNGYAVAAVNMPPASWGSIDAVQTIIDTQSFLHDFGIYPFKHGLVGIGTGGLAALNYYANGATFNIAGGYLWTPITDLYWAHLQPGWGTEIDAAYGGNYPQDIDGFNPADYAADLGVVPIPTCIAHPTDDTVVPYQLSVDFINAVDNPAYQLRKPDFTGGHGSLLTAVTGPELLAFFETQADWSND